MPPLLAELLGPELGPVAALLLLQRETAIVKWFADGSLIDVGAVAAVVSDIVGVIAAVAANAASEAAVAIAVGTLHCHVELERPALRAVESMRRHCVDSACVAVTLIEDQIERSFAVARSLLLSVVEDPDSVNLLLLAAAAEHLMIPD